MLRAILSVIAGYLAMAVIIMVSFTVAFVVLGTEGAFKEGSFDPSTAWIVVSLVVSVVAAVAGGLICALISRGGKAPVALAVVVLLLGVLSAIPALMSEETTEVRTADLTVVEAMGQAQPPLWNALLMPLIGAAGVILGARMRRRSSGDA